ncbi:MAG: hypothetical protein JXQ73_10650 [Phycisphaerae bacterium]|nr:hypothetical protein [Phycisphaerae bacterium]
MEAPRSGQFSKEELRDILGDFEDFFQSAVKQAANELDETLGDRQTRRVTLEWRVRMIPACHTALKQADPVKAFLESWVLCARMRLYFTEGDGRTLFGKQQSVAVDASKQVEAEIERIGKLFLSSDAFAKTREDVYRVAGQQPITNVFVGAGYRSAVAAKDKGPDTFAAVLTLPLAPFRTFQGIDRGAAAIVGLTDTADRFTDVVDDLPESTRWQMQLLLLAFEDSDLAKSALASWEEIANSSSDLAGTAERLPERVREQATLLIDELDKRQPGIQTTLSQAQQTADSVDQALARFDMTAETLDLTARSVDEAGKTWVVTANTIGQVVQDMAALGKDKDATTQPAEGPTASPLTRPTTTQAASGAHDAGRSFDILDYRDTADSLAGAATELQKLALEIKGIIESPNLPGTISDVDARVLAGMGETATQVRGLTDHIAWRLIQIIAFSVVVLAVYRIAAARLLRKVDRPASS